MTEVRIRVPEKQAMSWFAKVCDGDVKLSDIGLNDDAHISVVPVVDTAEVTAQPPDEIDQETENPLIFTEVVETEDGQIELITKNSLRNFAEYEIQAGVSRNPSPQGHRYSATRAYNSLLTGLEQGYSREVLASYGPGPSPDWGIKADSFEGVVEKLQDGSLQIEGLGENSQSRALILRFAKAFLETRKAKSEALESSLIGLGASALATQRHELELKLGLT